MTKKIVTPFDSFVLNAIDFLKTSLDELESRPKYSIINFYSAIELFFKARLFKEHWSLVVGKPEKANLTSFNNGEFKSVSLVEANQRLINVCNDGVSKTELDHFISLREHRNKLVHFYNEKYARKTKKDIYEIISEQCKAWYYLHNLLTVKWKDVFKDFKKDINKLNKKMLSNRKFLRAKFDTIKPQLNRIEAKGIGIQKCFACGFVSSEETEIHAPLYTTKCHVCAAHQRYLLVPCSNDDCGSNIFVYDLAEGDCDACGQHIDIDYLIGQYGQHISPRDSMCGPPAEAYCNECDFIPASVIPLGEDETEWLCLNCLEIHNPPGECEFCNEYVTGDLESSYAFGCIHCGGAFTWED